MTKGGKGKRRKKGGNTFGAKISLRMWNCGIISGVAIAAWWKVRAVEEEGVGEEARGVGEGGGEALIATGSVLSRVEGGREGGEVGKSVAVVVVVDSSFSAAGSEIESRSKSAGKSIRSKPVFFLNNAIPKIG